jgi:hypothetical protein
MADNLATLASFSRGDFLQVPKQKTDGERLRVRPLEVNNVADAIRCSA